MDKSPRVCLCCPKCSNILDESLSTDSVFCSVCNKRYGIVDQIKYLVDENDSIDNNTSNLSKANSPTNDIKQRIYWEKPHNFRDYDHPVVREFALQRIGVLKSMANFKDINSGLDVGCGSGFSTYYTKDLVPYIWGVDMSERMLHYHPFINEGRLIKADARRLPFKDNSFDIVYGWEALHHISNPESVISEMARVSKKYILIIEPNPLNIVQFLFALADREHRWVLNFKLSQMSRMVEACNLKIVCKKSGGWLFPNKTPQWLMPLLKKIPYKCKFGISNWILAEK